MDVNQTSQGEHLTTWAYASSSSQQGVTWQLCLSTGGEKEESEIL